MKYIKIILLTILLASCDLSMEWDNPNSSYLTVGDFILPFRGEALVFWGGRKYEDNVHTSMQNQTYAIDLVALPEGSVSPRERDMDKDITFTGDKKDNNSYYIFGRELIAPHEGIVVAVKDGVPDNIPGEINSDDPEGNYVLIDHGNGQFSLLGHMKNGSIVVSQGDRVEKGELLGQCGNSGYSTEPHIHYHMQDRADLFNGVGLPVQFSNYIRNGELVERGEPKRREIIRNQ